MPELRARSRTPSTSRSGPASPEKSSSPRKGVSDNKWSCCSCFNKLSGHRKQQVTTGLYFLLAGLVIAGGICTVHHRVDVKFGLNTLAERMAFTFRVLLFSAITLSCAIKFVAYKRFMSGAINPLSGNDRAVDVPNRILQNTLEQFAIHAAGVTALATYLHADQMKFVPLLAAFFVLGRIFFYLGYPSKRCFGFALTYIPTALSFYLTLYYMYTRGIAAF